MKHYKTLLLLTPCFLEVWASGNGGVWDCPPQLHGLLRLSYNVDMCQVLPVLITNCNNKTLGAKYKNN